MILCTGHRWRKTKEQKPWNNTTKQIFPEQKSKKSFALRHLCPVQDVLTGILNPLTSGQICQFIWSSKVYIWMSVWEFQKVCLWQPCLHKLMHVENWACDHHHELYVDISYKFTLAMYLFLMRVHTETTMNSFVNDLVLFKRIIQC